MRITPLALAIFLSSTPLLAQQPPEWSRVYTFDDSIIEMNNSLVTFGGDHIGRVRFRWSFNEPEALSGEPRLKFKSRLEVIEFDCAGKRYRPYEVTSFDAAGKVIRFEEMNPPGLWIPVTSNTMMEKLFAPACRLIELTRHPPQPPTEAPELKKAAELARSFSQRLEREKDFTPLIKPFFAPDFLNGYLQDKDTDWFFNLNRDVAAQVSRAELQRFYTSLLNAAYLSSLYLISRYPPTSDESLPEEKLIPAEIIRLIKNHPYTATYGGASASGYGYLAERIDSAERLQSYTDLLERIVAVWRKYVIKARAEGSEGYWNILEEWDGEYDLYRPSVVVCARECLGSPAGTRLYEVNVPVFRLQLAEVKGEMRIVSAMPYLQ